MSLINFRKGLERMACLAALLCIIVGSLMAFNSISEGYIDDASFGIGLACYGAVFFVYASQIILWVIYGFAGETFSFKLNPLLLIR